MEPSCQLLNSKSWRWRAWKHPKAPDL